MAGKAICKILQKYLLPLCFIPLTVLAAELSWKYHLLQHHLVDSHALSISLQNIKSLFVGKLNSYEQQVLQTFFSYKWRIVFALLPLACFMTACFFIICKRDQVMRFAIWQLILITGFITYLFGMLLMYLFSFTEIANISQSMTRFYNAYIIAWALFVFAVLIHHAQIKWQQWRVITRRIAFTFSLLSVITLSAAWAIQTKKQYIRFPYFPAVDALANKLQQQTGPNSSILIVWQNLPDLNRAKIAYELIPRHISLLDGSETGAKQQIKKLAPSYDYVVFVKAKANGVLE